MKISCSLQKQCHTIITTQLQVSQKKNFVLARDNFTFTNFTEQDYYIYLMQ